jgi:IS30 family transposase
MSYTHLSQEERYQIYELHVEKKTLTEIAKALNRHKSTIQREIKRNMGGNGWRPLQAHKIALERQTNCRNARRINEAHWLKVADYLRMDLSPQQILGRLPLEGGESIKISHEAIYRRIYADRQAGGDLIQHLRCQKSHRKRYAGGVERRGVIKDRVSIEQRPAIVEQKVRLGDWEGDTVIGKNQQGVIITLVDRVSRLIVAGKRPSKHAKGVAASISRLLKPHIHHCHTITFDNGKEFADHQAIAARLQAKVYFTHPYRSWERGLNENTNGLLRQYFPKKTNFNNVSHKELQVAVDKLNHRPRKCLGYRTPFEVFYNKDILPLKTSPCCTS